MKIIILLIILFFHTSHLIAQTMSGVPYAKEDTFHSEIVGDDYQLKISLPFPYNPLKNKYPVLYYLDAFGSSAGINELVKSKMFSNSIDQMIVVGISYNTSPMAYGKLRWRDYVPASNTGDKVNQGDNFFKFIKTELSPYMEANYGTDPNNRGLLGFSLSGFFSTWVIKKDPNFFNKLIILSPSLHLGDGFLLKDLEFIDNLAKIKKLEVFLAYGSLESEESKSEWNTLFQLLAKNKNIEINHVVFQDESHSTVWNAATTRAILTLYKNKYKAEIDRGINHYKAKEYKKALQRFELAFEKFPEIPDSGDKYDLACLYALTGDSDNAFKYLQMLLQSRKNRYEKIINDPELNSLHNDKRWLPLINAHKNKL